MGGEIRLQSTPVVTKETLHVLKKHAPNPSRLMTDEFNMYQGLADGDTTHETEQHMAHEYVRGDVSTNTIESAFGLFTRAMVGSFHQVSHKHLDRYLDEFEFRLTTARIHICFRDTLTRLVRFGALPYEQLTA